MFWKMVHALVALLTHAAVLLAAHGLATHAGREILELVRDEWVVGVAGHMLAMDE